MTSSAFIATHATPCRAQGAGLAFNLGRIGRCAVVGGLVLALAGCAFPRRDVSGLPGPEVIQVTQVPGSGLRAVPPDCAALAQPSLYSTLWDRRSPIAFGCATYTNLANQVARPKDLVQPEPYAGQSADTAGAAVKRYRENAITPLRGTRSTDVGAGK